MVFFGVFEVISVDDLGKNRYENPMTIPDAPTLPQTSSTAPSLEQLLAAALTENERLLKLVDELRQEIVALKQENAAFKQEIAALTRENIALRDRLNQNSTNSNQPPSQDSPFGESQTQADSAAREAEERAESKAKKSRPYHKGARQPLLEPDEVIPCLPGPCPSCGCFECVDLREGESHQWIELRESPVWVVHCRRLVGRCSRCGKRLKGRVPKGYETGYGPRLTALIATLNAGMAVSRRKMAECLGDVFGIPISQGGDRQVHQAGVSGHRAAL